MRDWDLRSGKSIAHFLGHAKRVFNTIWSTNGFQLLTSGDDGTIKVWDVRQKQLYTTIPAHSRLISNMVMERVHGEVIATSSFDGLVKLWSARDWSLISTLKGHDGKVMGVDIQCKDGGGGNDAVVSVGYDKTVKLWK